QRHRLSRIPGDHWFGARARSRGESGPTPGVLVPKACPSAVSCRLRGTSAGRRDAAPEDDRPGREVPPAKASLPILDPVCDLPHAAARDVVAESPHIAYAYMGY